LHRSAGRRPSTDAPSHFPFALIPWPPPLRWLLLGVGVARRQPARLHSPAQALDSSELTFDGQNYRVVHLDLKREKLSLHWRDPQSGAAVRQHRNAAPMGRAHGQRAAVCRQRRHLRPQFAPLGLYVENGKTVVPLNLSHGNPASGNFSLLPNGVFVVYPTATPPCAPAAISRLTAKPRSGRPSPARCC
jgi:hypothetical protein